MQWLRVAAALEQQLHCWSLVAMAEYQRASSSSCVKLGQAEPNATDHHMMGVYCYARTTSAPSESLQRGGVPGCKERLEVLERGVGDTDSFAPTASVSASDSRDDL